MPVWTHEELEAIGAAEELQISPVQEDGSSSRWVIIWGVRLGDDLYVRSYLGRSSHWFRGTQARHEGRIRAGGIDKDVSLVEVSDPAINDRIDGVYRTKYQPLFKTGCRQHHDTRGPIGDDQAGAAPGSRLRVNARTESPSGWRFPSLVVSWGGRRYPGGTAWRPTNPQFAGGPWWI